MSGHSKWSTIKRKKGALDTARSKVFQKLAKEIFVAAKNGDANIESNAALRMVIDKAKSANMPKDKIEAAINKANGKNDTENYESIRYEGYGPGGVAVMVDCLTDNKNRTASMVRAAFTKRGGNLGTDGSVAYLFKHNGLIVFESSIKEDDLMEIALLNNALDFNNEDGIFEVTTEPKSFSKIKKEFDLLGINDYICCEVTYQAINEMEINDDLKIKINNLIIDLENLDDVQAVFHNIK